MYTNFTTPASAFQCIGGGIFTHPGRSRSWHDARMSVLTSTRSVIRRNPTADRVYRTSVGVVGGATVALGIVLIPLPGPGALVSLGGLAILGTEFEGAKKVSTKANAAVKRGAAYAKRKRAEHKAKTTAV